VQLVGGLSDFEFNSNFPRDRQNVFERQIDFSERLSATFPQQVHAIHSRWNPRRMPSAGRNVWPGFTVLPRQRILVEHHTRKETMPASDCSSLNRFERNSDSHTDQVAAQVVAWHAYPNRQEEGGGGKGGQVCVHVSTATRHVMIAGPFSLVLGSNWAPIACGLFAAIDRERRRAAAPQSLAGGPRLPDRFADHAPPRFGNVADQRRRCRWDQRASGCAGGARSATDHGPLWVCECRITIVPR